MNAVRKIAKNTLFLFVGRVVGIVFGFIYMIYTARYLGAEKFGILNFGLSFTLVFGLLEDLGLSPLITREVARNKTLASKYIWNGILLKGILAIIMFALIIVSINMLGYPEQTIKVVYLFALFTTITNFAGLFNAIFQAFEEMEYYSIGLILNSVLMLIAVLVAINLGFDLVHFVSMYVIVATIVLLYSLFICIRKFLSLRIEIELIFWRQILKESIPFWLTNAFMIIYFKIDMIMLSIMKGDAIVGWYAASYTLIDALTFIPVVLTSVMYPVFSRLYINNENTLNLAIEKLYKLLILISIPLGIGTTILAEKIIVYIYGIEYTPSIIVLKILIWASVLSFVNSIPATVLNSIDKQRNVMIFMGSGAILNILLNYLLIPKMSFEGAGIATVATELFLGLLMFQEMKKKHEKLPNFVYNTTIKAVPSLFAMGSFTYLFSKNYVLVVIICASIVYFASLCITNVFEKEEIDLLNRALNK